MFPFCVNISDRPFRLSIPFLILVVAGARWFVFRESPNRGRPVICLHFTMPGMFVSPWNVPRANAEDRHRIYLLIILSYNVGSKLEPQERWGCVEVDHWRVRRPGRLLAFHAGSQRVGEPLPFSPTSPGMLKQQIAMEYQDTLDSEENLYKLWMLYAARVLQVYYYCLLSLVDT